MAQKRQIVNIEGRDVALSNLEKILFPAAKFTKGQMIDFYVRISNYLLPHLKDRPVTLKRYPDGIRGEFFYEKDAPAFTPEWVQRFPVPRRGRRGVIHYILINDLPTLVWVANAASIELHPFLHRVPNIDRPTSIVFDFDPGPGANILTCIRAAALVRDVLAELKLKCFAKVSGSKGLQVYVPLNTETSYSITQPFAKAMAQLMEQRHPDFIVSKMAKELRSKKVFIDWSQNSDFKTTVSVYSLRAKSSRPYVSMPVSWEELTRALEKKDAKSLYFEPEQALERVSRVHDLFEPVLSLKQHLPAEVTDRLQTFQTNAPLPKSRSKSRSDPRAHFGSVANPGSFREYRRKRDFAVTPEPAPAPAVPARSAQGSRRRFVIQKHAASHLHYDFRLEMHGALKSWAVPKGIPLTPGTKRLAMATEDHPLDYLDFEGVIPKGQYGGGTVMVWDIGTYELEEGNYYRGYLKIFLEGKKLRGEWALIKSRENGDARQNKWWLEKVDSSARALPKKQEDQSALTGRTLEQIATVADRTWQSNRLAASAGSNGSGSASSAKIRDEPQHELPNLDSLPPAKLAFVEPMLAKPVAKLPEGANWQYEIKLDGYRTLALKKDEGVTLYSRRGNRLNSRFPGIAAAFASLLADTMLDGEVVALDQAGRPKFNALQHANAAQPLYYYVFDILAYERKDLRKLPLSDRRRLLTVAVRGLGDPIRLSPTFDFPVKDIVRAAREQGLEGIVAKRTDSIYEPGKRSGAWVKYKTAKRQEFVVGGYLPGRYVFDALLVGYYEGTRLIFIAKIKNGFTPALRLKIAQRFKGLGTKKCPFANLPEPKNARRGKAITKEVMKECCWLKPRLVAEVSFTEWTPGNHLRHATFVALRDDKDPREVVKEAS